MILQKIVLKNEKASHIMGESKYRDKDPGAVSPDFYRAK